MITIQLVSSTSLKKIKLTSFDRKQLESYGFTAKSGEHIKLLNEEGGLYKVFFGFNDGDSIWNVASVTKNLPQGTYRFETDLKGYDLLLLHLVWYLSLYRFDRYKTQVPQKLHLIDAEAVEASRLQIIMRSINWLRDMVNTPAEDMGPGM